jgi:signal transduction histidine kinase/DNA-binding NarL/FixJ family response regulator
VLTPLRALIVEDSLDDTYFVIRHLMKGGFEPEYLVVKDGPELRQALDTREWDVILCDYSLPGFDAFGALRIVKETSLDLPFIVVSGSIDQETAVAAMKAGAHDYLLKDNLIRLVPAIRRELQEARSRYSRKLAERELAAVKEELAIQLADMTCLHQLSLRLSTARDLQQVTNEIVTGIQTLLGAEKVTLWLNGSPDEPDESSGHDVTLFTRSGEPLGRVGVRLGRSAGLSEREQRLLELYTRQARDVLDIVRLYEKAQEANRLKDEFVAMVSHELRTPLTPIMGAVHLIRSAADKEMVARALEMVERNVKSQAQIIEDLLDVSRIAAGKLRLRLTYIDIKNVVDSALATVKPAAEGKGIQLSVVFADREGVVLGDSGRLQQVIWNLLSNAVKFTPPGGMVQIETRNKDGILEICVTDSGTGIPADFLPFVFDRFRQADGSTTRAHGGLGLGLSIVRQVVELHGGDVHASSPGRGQGATFIVRLPMMARRPARSA